MLFYPPYYLYGTFNLNYDSFYTKSISTAEWLNKYFRKHTPAESCKVLDWGCGPGRVIRHLPQVMPVGCTFYGTDYNPKYIRWCSENIPGITFTINNSQPPLAYNDATFDIIYSISIFTHLSEVNHLLWFNELLRVLKPGGIILFTLHGAAFRSKMTIAEKKLFDNGELVVRSNTKEGHRTYAAFQPEGYVYSMVGRHQVLEYVPGICSQGKPEQDTWVIRKN